MAAIFHSPSQLSAGSALIGGNQIPISADWLKFDPGHSHWRLFTFDFGSVRSFGHSPRFLYVQPASNCLATTPRVRRGLRGVRGKCLVNRCQQKCRDSTPPRRDEIDRDRSILPGLERSGRTVKPPCLKTPSLSFLSPSPPSPHPLPRARR